MKNALRVALKVVVAVALLNLIAFVFTDAYYGGVPHTPIFHAPPIKGPFFLDQRGRLTEVGRQVFIALLWQTRSVVLCGLLALICGWILKRKRLNAD